MIKRATYLFFCCLFVLYTKAAGAEVYQKKLRFQTSPVIAYNQYNNTYFALADSTHYWVYQTAKKRWKQEALTVRLDISFQQLMNEFLPLAVSKTELLFVHASCGTVYSLSNGLLKRIDNSFIHRNQYGALIYEKNGTLYFFGGYGFFETKNTHSFYLRSANEWFAVSKSTTAKPSPRANSNYVQTKQSLFVFGGQVNKTSGTWYSNDCWLYDFATNQWELKGKLIDDLFKRLKRASTFNYYSSSLLLVNDQLIHLQPTTNQYYVYSNPYFISVKQVLPDSENKQVLVLEKTTNGSQYVINVVPFLSLLKNELQHGKIYHKQFFLRNVNFKYLFYGALLLVIFFVFLLVYKPTFIANKLNRNILLSPEQFSPLEWEIISLIYQRPNLELSELNRFFDEEQLNYETLKKRRESFMKSLRKKIAYITPINYSDIFIENKYQSDKRIKCVSLNKKIKITD